MEYTCILKHDSRKDQWIGKLTLLQKHPGQYEAEVSGRGLRGIKSHMKISGQFDSERTARYYAAVKTYIETCRRNHINEMRALSRLCAGNPYTVAEIFSK